MGRLTNLLGWFVLPCCLLLEPASIARAQGRNPNVQITQTGLVLTVLSMVILLIVFFLARVSKQNSQPESEEPPAAAPDADSSEQPSTPATNTEPAEEGPIANVRCPRCGQVVVDYKAVRRDKLFCPSCGELLRPAP